LRRSQRQATYYIDVARACLQRKGREHDAAAALYRADAIAPQQMVYSAGARAAVRTLLSRSGFGSDERLSGLANRIGATDQLSGTITSANRFASGQT
jgi:hypothetical protein